MTQEKENGSKKYLNLILYRQNCFNLNIFEQMCFTWLRKREPTINGATIVGIMTFSRATLGILTLSIIDLFATLSITLSTASSAVMLSVMLLNCYIKCHFSQCRYGECRYAECRYGECRYC